MNNFGYFRLLAALLFTFGIISCSPSTEEFHPDNTPPEMPASAPDDNGITTDDGDEPENDDTITEWDGESADDADLDSVGSDPDIYHEANSFIHTVLITYNNDIANVECSNKEILYHTSGAYVAIDMQTNDVANVEIILKGKSNNGGLKIYSDKKFKLTLDGVELASQQGPAINSQCKKRIFLHLNDGTTNRLTDIATYSTDNYYLDTSVIEDKKGCLFSEGNLIFSGTGVLVVAGKYNHGIATDGYFWMRPGVTIAITEAANDGINVKGVSEENRGIVIMGGLIYTNISAAGSKGIKTDLNIDITGGKLLINTSGNAKYDSEANDTTSAACIKANGAITISGGEHTLKSTGSGGKGLNADSDITINGGQTDITTTGNKYSYSSSITSSPKGVKADGNISISDGKLNILVTGKCDGAEGMESKAAININGGETYVYAYDDAINATTAFTMNNGRVYAYASNNDGIDSNGTLLISGGLVIANGANAPEGGIDVDNSNNFKIDGGVVISYGGALMSTPSSGSSQNCVIYNGISASKGEKVAVLDSSSSPILTYELPRTINSASYMFSCPNITTNGTYSISSNGTLSNYTDSWNGWYNGGTWSSGTELATFTISNIVTTIGNSTGGPGGPGGGGNGGPGSW